MPTWGCDWTWRQGEIPASRLQEEGFGYCWLKGGGAIKEGWSFTDPWFLRNAEALLSTEIVPGVFWYLMPGDGWKQAALLHGLLSQVSLPDRFMVKLDVEQAGITREDVHGFVGQWRLMNQSWPLWCYTRKSFWLPSLLGVNPGMLLEEAHWVPDNITADPQKQFASQQFKEVNPNWWDVNYAGWERAHMLQFSGHALVCDKWTTASKYPGSRTDLRRISLKASAL